MAERQNLITIQYLRGLAALLVAIHHMTLAYDGIPRPFDGFPVGASGVDLFFVISGMVIYHSTVGRDFRLGSFLYRRIIRIVPLYWAITLIVIGLNMAGGFIDSVVLDPVHILKSLLFVPHLHPYYATQPWPVVEQGWTLNYEMFFYVLFAVLMALAPSRNQAIRALVLVMPGLVALGLLLQPEPVPLRTYTNPLLFEFLAGVLFAVWLQERGGRLPAGLAWLAPVGLVLLLASNRTGLDDDWRVVKWGIPSAMIVLGGVAFETNRRLREIPFLKLLGDSSYSLYLSHTITQGMVRTVWRKLPLGEFGVSPVGYVILVLTGLAASVMAGILSYWIIERPSLAFLRGLPRGLDRQAKRARATP